MVMDTWRPLPKPLRAAKRGPCWQSTAPLTLQGITTHRHGLARLGGMRNEAHSKNRDIPHLRNRSRILCGHPIPWKAATVLWWSHPLRPDRQGYRLGTCSGVHWLQGGEVMTLRCPECRTRRATYASMARHIAASNHKLCHCGGYWHPHRHKSPCCEGNPRATVYRAIREGYEPLTAIAEWAWDTPCSDHSPICPF